MPAPAASHTSRARPAPAPAALTQHFSVAGFGGDIVQLADINGDGVCELLMLQSAGQFRSVVDSAGAADVDDADRALSCLTAVRLDSTVLWQEGAPDARPLPFTHHGGKEMLRVVDFDGDGRVEVAYLRNGDLAIRDGATGRLLRSVALPADNFSQLYTAQLGDPARGRQLLCKVNNRAYKPWRYGNPTLVLNADLSIYRESFAVPGAGHNMVIMDLDGDGRDELFIGYSLLDHRCEPRWTLDLGPEFNYTANHADAIDVVDVDGDGELEVCYAGSEDFYVTDLAGRLRWTARAGHSQYSTAGPWGPTGEPRVLMSEKNRGIWGLDGGGNILWNRADLNGYIRGPVRWGAEGSRASWALFRPQLKPIRPAPYESDPAWSRDLWPRFIDGDGTLLEIFPWREEYAHPPQWIRASRSYDAGLWYDVRIQDLDGDGADEVVLFNRFQVWVFRSA